MMVGFPAPCAVAEAAAVALSELAIMTLLELLLELPELLHAAAIGSIAATASVRPIRYERRRLAPWSESVK